MVVAVVLQARMGSTRLPGKALRPLAGRTVWDWVQRRVDRLWTIQLQRDRPTPHGIVALPVGTDNDELAALSKWPVWRGDEADVLGRFYDAVRFLAPGADTIMRVTADCPLWDAAVADAMLAEFAKGGCDYLSTSHPERTLPSGFDVEVFSRDALRAAHYGCSFADHREHVTAHLYDRSSGDRQMLPPAGPRCKVWKPLLPLPHLPHLSVDTAEDLARVEAVIDRLGRRDDFSYQEAWAACL